MIGSNPRPYLKAWGVPVERVVVTGTGDDAISETVQFLGIVSAPGREINFDGVVVVSDDYAMIYATAEVVLSEREKVAVLEGPDAGSYSVSKLQRSPDGVFSNAKLAKIQ